ncbi:MAG: FHA domain-containing protein [Lentisphaeria bacterium]
MASARILILSEQMRGTSFALTADHYTIGRAESCDICISDPTISGMHCSLTKTEDDRYALRDEGSTNGTKVNDDKITDDLVVLKNGDILQIGGVEVLFDNRQDFKMESRTMTVLSLKETGTNEISTAGMKNLAPALGKKRNTGLRENKKLKLGIFLVLGLLGIAAIGAVIITLIKIGN